MANAKGKSELLDGKGLSGVEKRGYFTGHSYNRGRAPPLVIGVQRGTTGHCRAVARNNFLYNNPR